MASQSYFTSSTFPVVDLPAPDLPGPDFRPSGLSSSGSAGTPGTRTAGRARTPVVVHPEFARLPPPVIVFGMHRSGTSLVAGMLGLLGVYLGPELQAQVASRALDSLDPDSLLAGYGETAAFFRLNELLLRRSGSTWSRVEPFLARQQRPAFRFRSLLALQWATCGPLRSSFLRGRTAGSAWGWKDPRNSLTLPFWLELFPAAIVLCVRRDPEAAALSLYRRALRWQASGTGPGAAAPSGLRRLARSLGLLQPPGPDPCLDLDYCRRLVRCYGRACDRACRLARARQGGACAEIDYERIVREPAAAAEFLAEAARIVPHAEGLRRAIRLARPHAAAGPACPSRAAGRP